MKWPALKIVGRRQRLTGFRHWWLKYVTGAKFDDHCARCLVGKYSQKVKANALINRGIFLDEAEGFDYLYLCGVNQGGRGWHDNFHLAIKPTLDAGDQISVETYNGFEVKILGGKQVNFDPLPDKWRGMAKSFTTCRNYQFAVHAYSHLLPDHDKQEELF